VQQNTLEWMPIFLPALWLFSIYVSDIWAALAGLVWIVGRLLYIRGYLEAAEKRYRGFFVQLSVCGVLWAGALIGIVLRLAH
jgi:glutathione S-transferase